MPAVAVVGGIAAAAGAASGAAALIGGAITMANVAAGLAFVGGVATALGGITGNKKLMKFGMITGLAGAAVGGIASLANSATDAAASAGASTAASVSDAVATSADALTIAPASEIATSVASGQNLVDPFMVTAQQTPSNIGMLGSAAQQAPVAAEVAANASNIAAVADPAAVNTTISGGFAPNASNVMSDAAGQLRLPQASAAGGGGAFGNFGQFLQKNSELVKVGTGMLSGLGQASMQKSQMEWQQRMDAERRARINASILGQKSNY